MDRGDDAALAGAGDTGEGAGAVGDVDLLVAPELGRPLRPVSMLSQLTHSFWVGLFSAGPVPSAVYT